MKVALACILFQEFFSSIHKVYLYFPLSRFSRRAVRAEHPAADVHGVQPREGRQRAPEDKRQRRVGHNVPAPGAAVKQILG